MATPTIQSPQWEAEVYSMQATEQACPTSLKTPTPTIQRPPLLDLPMFLFSLKTLLQATA